MSRFKTAVMESAGRQPNALLYRRIVAVGLTATALLTAGCQAKDGAAPNPTVYSHNFTANSGYDPTQIPHTRLSSLPVKDCSRAGTSRKSQDSIKNYQAQPSQGGPELHRKVEVAICNTMQQIAGTYVSNYLERRHPAPDDTSYWSMKQANDTESASKNPAKGRDAKGYSQAGGYSFDAESTFYPPAAHFGGANYGYAEVEFSADAHGKPDMSKQTRVNIEALQEYTPGIESGVRIFSLDMSYDPVSDTYNIVDSSDYVHTTNAHPMPLPIGDIIPVIKPMAGMPKLSPSEINSEIAALPQAVADAQYLLSHQ